MMNFLFLYVFLLAPVSILKVKTESKVVDLRCEHLTAPLGVDTKTPRLNWKLSVPIKKQKAYQIIVGVDSGNVANDQGYMWNSGLITSSRTLDTYRGKALEPYVRYYWKVNAWDENNQKYASDISFFEMGGIHDKMWKKGWITDSEDINLKPASLFRRLFSVSKKIKQARAYVAAAGLYEFYINGEKVGDHRLSPAFTRFDRRLSYLTYDITHQLSLGKNALGIVLGNGWYNLQSVAVWGFEKASWRGRPKFCLNIRIVYEDNEVEWISTDNNWKTSFSSIIFNSIYTGEHIDARNRQEGWSSIHFEDKEWKDALLIKAPDVLVTSELMHPIRDIKEIHPIRMKKLSDSCYVFDFGRNMAGVSELTIGGKRGSKVYVRHAERMDENFNIDMSNIDYHYRPIDDSDPFQTDIFILSGLKEETFRPLFNYKGFQYVEVKSSEPICLTMNSLKAYVMCSDVPAVGMISSSNPLLNKIWKATNRSYLSNLFGYPTDCPQREKNGWTGDAHIAIETGLYNFDAITLYEKWMRDHEDEQQADGRLPAIIPTSGWGYDWGNGVDWVSSVSIVPWTVYLFYNDFTILECTYETIRKYVDYMLQRYPDGITDWGLGDWIPIRTHSSKELTSSIYFYVNTYILSKISQLLHKEEESEKYASWAAKIKNAINARYFDRNAGIYGNGSQTELSMALYWGIVPLEMKAVVAENLAKRVEEDGMLDVGLLGSKSILNALSENGYANLAYELAVRETYPSWGWWINNGATTLYENWRIDGNKDISLNHIMFGEVSAWFYKALGGIYPDIARPGFEHIVLRPNFVEKLDRFEAKYISPYGKIVSSWKRKGDKIIYKVTVPPNSTASWNIDECYLLKNAKNKPGTIVSTKALGGYMVKMTAGSYSWDITKRK